MKCIDYYLNEVIIPLSGYNSLKLLFHTGNQISGHLHWKHKDRMHGATFVIHNLKTSDLPQPLVLKSSLICGR